MREETGHTSTHIPKTGNTQVNHREQGDPVWSRRNVAAGIVAWGEEEARWKSRCEEK